MLLLVAVTVLIAIILIPVLFWYVHIAKYNGLKSLPGPTPIPILGNTLEVGNTTVGLLQSFMNLQNQHGTIYKLWLGPRLHLMLAKPEYLEFILKSTVHLSKSDGYDLFKPWLGDGLLVSTGAKWKARRKLITPTFHFQILKEFLEVFNTQMNILLEILEEKVRSGEESIEIHQPINMCSLDIICETAFGTPINAQYQGNQEYVEAVSGFLEIFSLRFFSGWLRNPLVFRLSSHYHKYNKYLETLHDFTRKIIKQRKREYELNKLSNNSKNIDDGLNTKRKAALLDMLLDASNNGDYLTDEDIRDEVDTFMFEGHDTSSAAICFVLYAISQHTEVQTKVYRELIEVLGPNSKSEVIMDQINDLKYLDIVVKEAIRVYPPVPLIERRLEEDCTIDGITIPKETNISIFLYGMSYVTDVFPEPDKFDPERFLPEKQATRHNYAYVPFSAGPRNCIGQKFALLEVKASVAKILRHFELSPDPNFTAEIGMCSVLRSNNGIKLKLRLR